MTWRDDKNGNRTTYSDYDSKGNARTIVEASNRTNPRTTYYTYNAASMPTSIKRKSAILFGGYSTFTQEFTYDSKNNLIKKYSQGNTKDISGTGQFFNYSSSYTYNSYGQVLTSRNHLGRRVTFDYYSTAWGDPNHGRLKSITRSLDGVSYPAYFGNYSSGRPGWVRDFAGYQSSYIYDARGRLIAVTAHTRTTRFGYDAFGNMTSAVLPTGKKIGYEYDSANRLTKMRDSSGAFVNYSSDTEGNVTREVVYGSSAILKDQKMVYDANNRLERVTNPTLSITNVVYGYDNNGNVTHTWDNNNNETVYSYDDLDRLWTVTLPDPGDSTGTIPSSYEHDINDNTTRLTDGKNNPTNSVYDDLGRLVEVKDAENRYTRFEYDAVGNLVKIKDPKGNVTTFEYNEMDLVKKKTYADNKYETYTYNPDGKIHTKTNARNITATYSYDQNTNDHTGVSYSDTTPAVAYSYYANGLVQTRTDAVGLWQYTYDDNSRVQTVDGPWNNDTLTYYYDGLDRVVQIDQQGGEIIYYTYDTLSRLIDVTVGTRVFHYSYTGANTVPDKLTRPNGSNTFYTYDNLYRLKDINNKNSSGVVLTRNEFTYDKAHMKVQETITNAEQINLSRQAKTYTYNNVNQLTNSGYAYDADGNMTSFKTPEGYSATATYDAENHLKTIQYTDSDNITHNYAFTYNGDGLLAKQVIDGVETRFVRAGYLCLQERNASNEITRAYVWDGVSPGGIGGLLELTQGGEHYDYLYDGKSNVSALIDSNQQAVAAYRYDPIGKLISKSGTLDQPYQFSTKMYYPAIGVVKYDRRDDLPIIGKWMERDPIGEAGGQNLYGFVGNSPMNLIDPLGLEPPRYPGGPINYTNPFGGNPIPHNPFTDMTQRNVSYAQGINDPRTFKELVQSKGAWDYKRYNTEWQDFGNYNYGATGAAAGLFTLETLLREAGRAQIQCGTSKPEWGTPDGEPPYGDDPRDQYWIEQGYADYMKGMYGPVKSPNRFWGWPIQKMGNEWSKRPIE